MYCGRRANQESDRSCRRSGIAKASGARRAGQGRAAAKRTLDPPVALPENRRPERRQTRTRSLLESWAQHLRENRGRIEADLLFLVGVDVGSRSCGFSGSISTRTTHAPQHISETDIGRERPRRSALGPRSQRAGGVAHAPSLLRRLCWGAHRAAQCAARPDYDVRANTGSSKQLQLQAVRDVARAEATQDQNPL